MKKLFLLLVVACSSLLASAQTNLDSLYTVWQDEGRSDSLRTKAFKRYIRKGALKSNLDSAIRLAQELVDFGNQRNFDLATSEGYKLIGRSFDEKNNYSKAVENYNRALVIDKNAGRENLNANLMNTMGLLYGSLGNQTRELEYYVKGLRISQEMNDKPTMEMCVSNIGSVYLALGNYSRALEYFERGLQLEKEMGDSTGYAWSLNLIADVFRQQNDYNRALEYSIRSLEIHRSLDFEDGMVESFFSIGCIYKELKNYSLALDNFNSALKLNEEVGDSELTVKTLNKIGNIYREQGDYPEAMKVCSQSEELATDLNLLIQQRDACECLYLTHQSLKDDKYALKYLQRLLAIEDSLNTQETNNSLQQMEIAKQVLQDSIAAVESKRLAEEAHKEEVRQKNRTRNIFAGIGFFALLLAGGFYWRWMYVTRSKAELQLEKDRSENLLLNILPEEIAEELKAKGKADARDFDVVSILFTDFKGFTEASAKLSASELVKEINTCFEAFDGIMDKYGIEKIKTIGDAYMAAGGLPVPTDESVKNTVLAALEMQDFIQERKATLDAEGKPSFEMRVGVHTGPVVAGIVGVKKFQYDIWGDTVNTASRMESSG
ncbi:MAG: adenylate/guanylate cyclase domain-containing protein, partial [Flavobacteriales bacterium]